MADALEIKTLAHRVEGRISNLRMLTLRSGLKLEILGMKRHGKSCYSIIKAEFNLKGNKQSVLTQYEAILRKWGLIE